MANNINIEEQTKLEAFRQHWQEMRQTENLRFYFTSFYAVMVAGVLTYISQGGQGEYRILFSIIAVVSLFGLLQCLRIWQAIDVHRKKVKELAKSLTGEKDETKLSLYIPPERLRFLSSRLLFIYFYSLAFGFFVWLAYLGHLPAW